jgi:hypothetical protein
MHNKSFQFFELFYAHLQSKFTKSANKSKKFFSIKLKVPSHQIRLASKWDRWIGFHGYKNPR